MPKCDFNKIALQPMSKCDFNKVVCNFIEIALWHGCSPVNLLHIFRTPFSKNTSGWLLLIDSSKTFDIIDHLLLLKRLEMYFVNTTNLAWFYGRKQYLKTTEGVDT